jgi:hypothetical protein
MVTIDAGICKAPRVYSIFFSVVSAFSAVKDSELGEKAEDLLGEDVAEDSGGGFG